MVRRYADMNDSHKLSAESENLTLLLREDTEGRRTLGMRMRGVRGVRRQLRLSRPHVGGPGLRLQPVPEASHLHPCSYIMPPAVWLWPQKSAQDTVGWPRPSSVTVRAAILLSVCSEAPWKQPRIRAITQPKVTGISQKAKKTWPGSFSQEMLTGVCTSECHVHRSQHRDLCPRMARSSLDVPAMKNPVCSTEEGLSKPECADFLTKG